MVEKQAPSTAPTTPTTPAKVATSITVSPSPIAFYCFRCTDSTYLHSKGSGRYGDDGDLFLQRVTGIQVRSEGSPIPSGTHLRLRQATLRPVCTSGITDMRSMFKSETSFNANIGSWDVSSVTDMTEMFNNADAFNQSLNSWNVSSVTDMVYMFSNTDAFNGNIGSWDVSSVTDMDWMFYQADAFNQDIGSWDVSSVTDMNAMFNNADAFNGNIGSWDVSSVTDMRTMFPGGRCVQSETSDSWKREQRHEYGVHVLPRRCVQWQYRIVERE